jgi:hydroxymethylpyrimidine pyrophosphatase-like HAD family hydrolase
VSYSELRKTVPLLTPDLLICSVGTEIYHSAGSQLELDREWFSILENGWNREKITSIVSADFPKLTPQPDTEQRPHKASYHIHKEGIDEKQYIQSLSDRLKKEGLDVKLVYSGGIDVDVLPACASKGLALQFLQVSFTSYSYLPCLNTASITDDTRSTVQKRWEEVGCLPKDGIQVNGDSGNDAELFEVPGVLGCIVSNAMEELVHWADAHPSERLFRLFPAASLLAHMGTQRASSVSVRLNEWICFLPSLCFLAGEAL